MLGGAVSGSRNARAAGGLPRLHDGPVLPPLPFPASPLTLADGDRSDLGTLLAGRVTALQLIYTRCTTTCPMQGVLFQRVQEALATRPAPEIQLLSLTTLPEEDSPEALAAWLVRFGAGPAWRGGRPEPEALPELARFFGSSSPIDRHATQVAIANRRGELVWVTNALPAPESVVRLLRRLLRSTA
jgi:protein SCO1/2